MAHEVDLPTPAATLLNIDKTDVDNQAVARWAWHLYLTRQCHPHAFAEYIQVEANQQDYDHNLLVATDSAYQQAELELSAHVGQGLINLFE